MLFSLHNLAYLKLMLVWLGCVALDFVVGFRFELLWPVWLLFRHLYETFRTQAFASSLHYSAFSVFFVCVTATSDLVCYLFIPLQVLIFVASTYVWVQFVYSSSKPSSEAMAAKGKSYIVGFSGAWCMRHVHSIMGSLPCL